MQIEKKTEKVTKTVEVEEEVFVLTLTKEDVERLAGLFDYPTWSDQPKELRPWLESNHSALSATAGKWWMSAEAAGFKRDSAKDNDYDEDEDYDEESENTDDEPCWCGNHH